jgi:hypothetical protein
MSCITYKQFNATQRKRLREILEMDPSERPDHLVTAEQIDKLDGGRHVTKEHVRAWLLRMQVCTPVRRARAHTHTHTHTLTHTTILDATHDVAGNERRLVDERKKTDSIKRWRNRRPNPSSSAPQSLGED